MRRAWSVIDLGFGDAGKGATTDALVREHDVQAVVRHHGGAQAGHNVVLEDGRHHTFSQFGAGTFHPGCQTWLGPDFLLHPLGMWMEERHLQELGVHDAFERTVVHGGIRVISPYQQAINQARERARGAKAHGTCGVGVGECVSDALEHPEDTIRVRDLGDPSRLRSLLEAQRSRKADDADAEARELFEDDGLVDRVLQAWSDVAARLNVVGTERFGNLLADATTVVFEGAQGVLLDEWWGFHPHTTYSDCTGGGVAALWSGALTTLGVTRSYTCRHGAGPLPTEGTLRRPEQLHNHDEGWQGAFRVGALDGMLLRYAMEVAAPLDAIVVRHLDVLAQGPVCTGYSGLPARFGGQALVRGDGGDLAYRQALGEALTQVVPIVEQVEIAAWLAAWTRLPVLEAWGPRGPCLRV